MRLGRRVLALAYKDLGVINLTLTDFSHARSDLENQLIFAGFLIFDSPLKADSNKVINHLKQAGLETVMITGDSLLTAVEVAQRVGMVEKRKTVYELCEIPHSASSGPMFGFLPITRTDGSSDLGIPLSSIHSLKDACLCTTGETLTNLVESQIDIDDKMILLHPEAIKLLQSIVPSITIFARHVRLCRLCVNSIFL
jgi:magnesium-transporting ATPase (P-type)